MRFEYEEALPVSEHGFDQSPEDCRAVVQYGLEILGVQAKIIRMEFVEFDSGNRHHACGYWNVTLEPATPNDLTKLEHAYGSD